MELLLKYFNELTPEQINQFKELETLYKDWNSKINVISRKDIDELYLKHVLHSLAIAKFIQFSDDTKILDVGTGGGFPGIPLAIMFPKCDFHLVDSINKKLTIVNEVANAIGLENLKTTHSRVEVISGTYDFIVSRAVTAMPEFVKWVKNKISKKNNNSLKNGILYLKGGDLTQELNDFPNAIIYDLNTVFEESFFETKKLVYLSIKNKG